MTKPFYNDKAGKGDWRLGATALERLLTSREGWNALRIFLSQEEAAELLSFLNTLLSERIHYYQSISDESRSRDPGRERKRKTSSHPEDRDGDNICPECEALKAPVYPD